MRSVKSILIGIVFMWAAVAHIGAVQPRLPDRPLTLQDCISIALTYNPSITSSQQSVVSAEAGLEQARSGYWPQLSLGWEEGYTGTGSIHRGVVTQEEANFTVRQSLWQWGRRENVKSSRKSLTSATYTHEDTIQNLVEAVARDYYGTLAAESLMEVAQARVKFAREHLEEVKARVAVGTAAEVELFPAEDDLARADLEEIDASSNIRLAQAQLKNTLGLSPDTALKLAEPAAAEEQPLPSLQEAMQIAHIYRPDLISARASVDRSRYNLASAKIRRGPLVELFGQYQQGYSDWYRQAASWQALMSFSWPLFDGGSTRADETQAKADNVRAEAALQTLVNQVGLDVEIARVETTRTRQRVTATAKSVAAAQARLAAAEGKYREGMAIFLEVSDALAALSDARASQVKARYFHELARVRLDKALGRLTPEGFAEQEAAGEKSDRD